MCTVNDTIIATFMSIGTPALVSFATREFPFYLQHLFMVQLLTIFQHGVQNSDSFTLAIMGILYLLLPQLIFYTAIKKEKNENRNCLQKTFHVGLMDD